MTDKYDFITRFEGVIPHMYLDTNGYVTVGVGNMIPDERAARRLHMRDRANHADATQDELVHEYRTIGGMKRGLRASAYMTSCNLEMTNDEIRRLFDRRVSEFEMQLRAVYYNYDACPELCRLALLDLCFNLGAGALDRKWPCLKEAVQTMNWNEAAKQSFRPQSSTARNVAIAELFHAGYSA
jgi:GH24 family phage-related lysozyme (muramidase)